MKLMVASPPASPPCTGTPVIPTLWLTFWFPLTGAVIQLRRVQPKRASLTMLGEKTRVQPMTTPCALAVLLTSPLRIVPEKRLTWGKL